jgi:valyl-tRNA synthetase
LVDQAAEGEMAKAIETTKALRRWRDLAGVAAGATLAGRMPGAQPHELVGRLTRVEFEDAGGDAIATVAGVEILAAEGVDAEAVAARIEERRETLRSEVARAEGKLANDKFVAGAPPEVVEEERETLEMYRSELEDLS